MKILLVHQNFPGQFLHLGPALAARGHEVLALTDEKNTRPTPLRVVKYRTPEKMTCSQPFATGYADHVERGYLAARGARALRDRHGYTPDVIFGHSGWGETLFLKEIWPEAKLLVYAELLYRTRGHDIGFDPEMTQDLDGSRFGTIARSAQCLKAIKGFVISEPQTSISQQKHGACCEGLAVNLFVSDDHETQPICAHLLLCSPELVGMLTDKYLGFDLDDHNSAICEGDLEIRCVFLISLAICQRHRERLMHDVRHDGTCESRNDESALEMGFVLDGMVKQPRGVDDPYFSVRRARNDFSCHEFSCLGLPW